MQILKQKNIFFLLGTLFFLIVPVILFQMKVVDDNSLCRWSWVFGNTLPLKLYGLLFAVILGSYFLSRSPWPTKYQPVLLGLLASITAVSLWSEPEVIMDASRYFSQAKYLSVHGVKAFWTGWGHEFSAWTDLPLMPFLWGMIIKFLGEERIYLQALTTLFFVGSVLLTYFLGKELWDEEVGLLAGILLLCYPYLLLHIPLMMVDLPSMFFLLLSIFTFCRVLSTTRPYWILLAALAISLTLLVKYSTWLYLTILPVISIVRFNDDPRRITQRSLYVLVAVLIFSVPVAFGLWETMSEQLGLLFGYQRAGLGKWSESFISTSFFHIHPLVSVAALLSVYAAWKKRDKKIIILSFLIMLIIVLEIKRIRYILPVFPMLALMAAYYLRRLHDKRLRRYLILGCLGSSLLLTFGAYLPFVKKLSAINIQKAGQFLNTLETSRASVYIVEQESIIANLNINIPLLDLFTDATLYSLPVPSLLKAKATAKKDTSFRFTWEQELPDFYNPPSTKGDNSEPLVIISTNTSYVIPPFIRKRVENYSQYEVFDQKTKLFTFRTVVAVFYD